MLVAIYLLLVTYYNFYMQPRTKRQREVLDYIASFIEERGYKPSYQQIARHFQIKSKSAVAKHIAALEHQGLLARYRENGCFSLQVRPKNLIAEAVFEIRWLELPFKDKLVEDFENEPFYVPNFLLGNLAPERIFAFRIRNNSMIDEQICEGDIALIEKRAYARDGDNVVVLIEKTRVAVKKYFRQGANIELRPSNPNYNSIHLPADKISIQGVLHGLLRPAG